MIKKKKKERESVLTRIPMTSCLKKKSTPKVATYQSPLNKGGGTSPSTNSLVCHHYTAWSSRLDHPVLGLKCILSQQIRENTSPHSSSHYKDM